MENKTNTQEFEFFMDQKETIWTRTKLSIEAESFEEAKKELIEAIKNKNIDAYYTHNEIIDDSYGELTPEQNGGDATILLGSDEDDYEEYWDNVIGDYTAEVPTTLTNP